MVNSGTGDRTCVFIVGAANERAGFTMDVVLFCVRCCERFMDLDNVRNELSVVSRNIGGECWCLYGTIDFVKELIAFCFATNDFFQEHYAEL